jgi:very-short-patch-repair endonuclease
MDPVAALTRLGGVSSFRELERLSSRRTIANSRRAGDIVRVKYNVYALPVVNEARLAAARVGGVVSHLSAALSHGLKVKDPPKRPMVTVARNRSPRDVVGIDLKYANLRPDEVLNGATSLVRTVIDCARALPYDEALAVADSALRSRKVTRQELIRAAEESPRSGRSRALEVVREASPRAANPFESVLRAIARDVAGLVVVPQGEVGTIGHADLTDARLRIAIEADSYEHHSLPEAFRYDVRRYTAMVRLGWLVVRFVWEDVMRDPDEVRAVLADVVAWRTPEKAVHPMTP